MEVTTPEPTPTPAPKPASTASQTPVSVMPVAPTVIWPTAATGWIAVVAAVIGLGSWIVLPLITTMFGEKYPVTDSWVMPTIGVVLVGIAVIVNLLGLLVWKQRSVVNIVAAALVIPAGLFLIFIAGGELLGGA